MLLNYGAGKDSWESFELQGDQTSHSKENQPWIFIGRADAEALVLWPPDAKSQLIEKDPDAEKDWRQKRKGATEGEMVEWHLWPNGHEFEQTLGYSGGLLQFMESQRIWHDLATEQQQQQQRKIKTN